MKYSLHIGNNEDSRGSLEIIFYFLILILFNSQNKASTVFMTASNC